MQTPGNGNENTCSKLVLFAGYWAAMGGNEHPVPGGVLVEFEMCLEKLSSCLEDPEKTEPVSYWVLSTSISVGGLGPT